MELTSRKTQDGNAKIVSDELPETRRPGTWSPGPPHQMNQMIKVEKTGEETGSKYNRERRREINIFYFFLPLDIFSVPIFSLMEVISSSSN